MARLAILIVLLLSIALGLRIALIVVSRTIRPLACAFMAIPVALAVTLTLPVIVLICHVALCDAE